MSLAIATAQGLAGCGALPNPDDDDIIPLVYSQCPGQGSGPFIATDSIYLDWSGGTTNLVPDGQVSPLDFSAFELSTGGTLADDPEGFKRTVLQQVQRIFCEFGQVAVHVEEGDDEDADGRTIVFIGQDLPRLAGQVGEADYDVCNTERENDAILYGEQIRRLGNSFTLEQWAMMFSNTIAHEIGHTLGYGHVLREDAPDSSRALFVELMLDRHTLFELTREQRFVLEQSNCDLNITHKDADGPVIGCMHQD